MEISKDDSENKKVNTKNEYGVWSEPGEHEDLDKYDHSWSKLYHQKTKDIQMTLLTAVIISWW